MSENKTKPTESSVHDFLEAIENEQKRADAFWLLQRMKTLSGCEPVLWGPSLIGFGTYHYKYDSGREGDFFRIGFSPRKTSFSLYIMAGFSRFDELLEKLGNHKTGKSCLYIKRLSDINEDVLDELMIASLEYMAKRYPE